MRQTFGFAPLAIGVILLVFGLNGTEEPLDQAYNTLTGDSTDTTMWYIGGGFVALFLGGLTVFLWK